MDAKLINFTKIVGKLKRIKRAGWVKHGIPNPESVAEHVYRTAVMALILTPQNLDQNKVLQMCLIHDIGEAEIGDIITHKGKEALPNLEVKLQKERGALVQIFSQVDRSDLIELFDEFEEGKTKEAIFAKQLDRLETAIQASEYKEGHDFDDKEFYEYAEAIITDPKLKGILSKIL